MPDDKPVNRRAFFREGWRGLLRPLSAAIAPVERAAHQLGKLEFHATQSAAAGPFAVPAPPKTSLPVWLRPPGALPEQKFRDTCSRCGQCESVCPAHCIRIDASGANGHGAPYIDANTMACVVCTGLNCMQTCPSGALVPTPLADIDMGTAVWNHETCVRTNGEDCTICVDHCPLGTAAIELKDGDIHVVERGCIGCGVCQHDCPTNPKSIVVIPKENWPQMNTDEHR
jgi:ferredoxin-type protein NapG